MIFERGHFKEERFNESLIKDSLNESRTFSQKTFRIDLLPTVFISHKHDDIEDLYDVMGHIKKLGAKIYIDSMDNRMPGQTSGGTATRIKEIIRHCEKFILLATNKAIESYWCNWELGLGDAKHFPGNIAILPMKEKGAYDFQYEGNEYLQIYSRIDYEDGGGYYVTTPIGSWNRVSLKNWISRQI